jgi:hypothetical protein
VTHEPISPNPATDVGQTPASAASPLAGLFFQSLPKPASGSACRPAHKNYVAPGFRLPEHLIGQAVSPVLRSLPLVFGSTHLSHTARRGREDIVRTPR